MDHLLNTAITVRRKTNTGTSYKPVWAFSLVYTGMGCINKLSESRVVRNEGGVIVADHQCYLKTLTLVNGDRIVKTSDSTVYDIYNVDDPNLMGRHIEVTMKLMSPGTLESMGSTGLADQRLVQRVTVTADATASKTYVSTIAVDILMVVVTAKETSANGALTLRSGANTIAGPVACAVDEVSTINETIATAYKRITVGQTLNIIATGDTPSAVRGEVLIIGVPYAS